MRLIFAVVGCCMSFGSGPVAAQDMTGAEDLYRDTCRNCHGPKAKGMASFPKLAGLEEDFLAMRLTQYRAGEKVGPNSALMQPNAIDLSDEEISDLARYISTSFD